MAESSGQSSSFSKKDASIDSSEPKNKFQNDGSFMEMFKKKMEEDKQKKVLDETKKSDVKTKALPMVGKRRLGGMLTLKTGAVKKKKTEEDEEDSSTDAWSKYMAEVKKYKAQNCQDEDKTRPLVK